jgi:hypothetical protein
MDGSETNFSGWRGAVDEARKGFVADQVNLVRRLNRPAYRWKLAQHLETTKDQALKKAYKKLGESIFNHNWNLPTWSYIEPVADAEGDATQLKNALTSPRRLHAARGRDWEQIVDETTDDNTYAIEKAQAQAAKLNAAFPGAPPVNWRDLIALPMPAGTTMAMQDPAAIAVQEKAASGESEASSQPSGEFAGLSTLQYERNKKAIKRNLADMISGVQSEVLTRVFLESVGMNPKNIDLLIQDAKDGKVDSLPPDDSEVANVA